MDNRLDEQIALINEMLEIGEKIMDIGLDFALSKEILSLMATRDELFARQAKLHFSEGFEAGSAEGFPDGLEDRSLFTEVVKRLIQQNSGLETVLHQHLERIGRQRDLVDTALKANRTYHTTDYVKSIARGLQVDASR